MPKSPRSAAIVQLERVGVGDGLNKLSVTDPASPTSNAMSDPRRALTIGTLRLTAEVVEILNALSCVAYRETRPIFSPSVGLLGLPAIDSVTPATKLDWEIGVGPKTRALTPQ